MSPVEPEGVRAGDHESRFIPGLALLFLLGAALRLVRAFETSLWLDELHTWHHASADSLGALLRSLRADNHPPLSFAAARASRLVVGGSEFALRLPSVLAGVACIGVATRVARRAGLFSAGGRLLAGLLVACSTLHLAASAEARMYAWLALFAGLALDGALGLAIGSEREARRGAWVAAGALLLATHTHYHGLYLAALIGAGLLAAAPRARLRLCGAPGVGLVACALPWFVWGFREQLDHDLPPGGAGVTPGAFAGALAKLFFHNASLGGAAKPVFLAAAVVALGLACLGAARLSQADERCRRSARLLAALAFGLPALAAGVALVRPRAGFHWVYLTPAVLPMAVLIAAGATGGPLARARRVAVAAVASLALTLALLHLGAPSREEHRDAAQAVCAEARAGDAVIAAEWQPALFPQGLGWRFYSARLPHAPELLELTVGPGFAIEAPERLADCPRAFFLGRSMPGDAACLQELRRRYPEEDVERFGDAIYLHRFTR